jgi:hypothetical protein
MTSSNTADRPLIGNNGSGTTAETLSDGCFSSTYTMKGYKYVMLTMADFVIFL